MPTMTEEATEAADRLRAALPNGWYAGHLAREWDMDPRPGYPSEYWTVTFMAGRSAGAGPTRYYVGGSAQPEVGRRTELTVRGGSLDDLVAVAETLAALEPVVSLRWPIEVDLTSYAD